VDADEAFPAKARQAFTGLFDQFKALTESIVTFEAEIVAHARYDETARRLATIPGIGPITASFDSGDGRRQNIGSGSHPITVG
jgi:transposase